MFVSADHLSVSNGQPFNVITGHGHECKHDCGWDTTALVRLEPSNSNKIICILHDEDF